MTTKLAAETMFSGLRHVGATDDEVLVAASLLAAGNYEAVGKLYEGLENEMWETRKEKDEARGRNEHG